MYTPTALLPLLAFAFGISAAPMPTQSISRAVPDINEVARNPAPIDDRVHWEDGKPSLGDIGDVSWEDLQELNDLIHHLSGEKAASDIDRELTAVKRSATPNYC